MRIVSLLFALFCVSNLLSAQAPETPKPKSKNLVLNPSFEIQADTTRALDLSNQIDRALGWSNPNDADAKLYTSIKKGNSEIVYDPNGSSWDFKARTGKNVAGVNVRGGAPELREYIQGTLTEPLTVGKKYYFGFWVHYHCEGANNIGIAFLPEKIKLSGKELLPLKPVSYQAKVTNYDKKIAWFSVRDSFVAQKPYNSFIIGNFLPDSMTDIQSDRYNHYFAYIDDIVIVEARNQSLSPAAKTEKEKEKWDYNDVVSKRTNTAIALENIYFKFATAELLPESNPSLEKLLAQMRVVPTLKIRINGHTSEEGGAEYNQKLSENRAKAIKNYLVKKGIAQARISTKGFGESAPMPGVLNDTEENRAKNRRVEFEILEK